MTEAVGDPAMPSAVVPGDQAGGAAEQLITRIRSSRREFRDAGQRSQDLRTLPADAVQLLRTMGAFWLKTPAECGGTPLHPLEFCDVIEELAYADTSAAWACMIGNGCAGMAAGWLPDAGVRRVFQPGQPLPVVAGQPQPRGTARAADGGYVVSGRWSFASGIGHSSWVIGAVPLGDEAGGGLVFVVPRDQAEVIDNWHVAGLQGTGSLDFRLDEVLVPQDLTFGQGAGALRGGDLFRQERHLFVSNEVPPLCVGMARQALDEMTALAGSTARFAGGPALSERAVFLKELGRAEVRIRAARLVHRDAIAAAYEAAQAGNSGDQGPLVAVAAASVFTVETCAEVISDLFRYGGGRVLSLASPMQRHLRDALAARQHLALTEQHYEAAGRQRIAAWAAGQD